MSNGVAGGKLRAGQARGVADLQASSAQNAPLGLRMIAINLLQNCHFRLQRGRIPPVPRSARLKVCLFREPARRATLLHRSGLSTHHERVILQGRGGVWSRR
jgi:hypothetical protein